MPAAHTTPPVCSYKPKTTHRMQNDMARETVLGGSCISSRRTYSESYQGLSIDQGEMSNGPAKYSCEIQRCVCCCTYLSGRTARLVTTGPEPTTNFNVASRDLSLILKVSIGVPTRMSRFDVDRRFKFSFSYATKSLVFPQASIFN